MPLAPFLVSKPYSKNARIKLQQRSDDWRSAYPIAVMGPLIIPWGPLLPQWMLPASARKKSIVYGPVDPEPKPLRRNLSSLTVSSSNSEKCMFLYKLPPELRLVIYSYVLGNDRFRLITIPWKVVAAPDIAGNLSMTQDHLHPPSSTTAAHNMRFPTLGIGLLVSCRQIYQETIDLLYSSNTFILCDFHTLDTFAQNVLPQRLNTIRSLEITYSPETSIPYQHERTPHYDLPRMLDWDNIVKMKNLRHLDVYLEAYNAVHHHGTVQDDEGSRAIEIDRLKGLLQVRGLSTFRLELAYLDDDSKRTEPYAPLLRHEIMENVKKPREP